MLTQIQHQFDNGQPTEMVAQKDIETNVQLKQWTKDIMPQYPLPEGAQWRICTLNSEHFILAAKTL